MLLNVKCKVKFVIKIPYLKKISQLPSLEDGVEGSLLGLPSDRVRVIQHPASRSILGDLFVKLLGKYTKIQLLYHPVYAETQAGILMKQISV